MSEVYMNIIVYHDFLYELLPASTKALSSVYEHWFTDVEVRYLDRQQKQPPVNY